MISDKLKKQIREIMNKRSPYFLNALRKRMGQENRDSQIRKQYYDNNNLNSRLYNPGKS